MQRMKLSEAISLGHTLIGEIRTAFRLEGGDGSRCGCAIGSAAEALGAPFMEQRSYLNWLRCVFPWTKGNVREYPELFAAYVGNCADDLALCEYRGKQDVAYAISGIHSNGMPRLRIAEIIARIEPQGEEGLNVVPDTEAIDKRERETVDARHHD